MTAGFIGLGAMGYPMAGHIAKSFKTLVWNRTEVTAQRHAAEFGSRAVTDRLEAAACDVILTCLPTSRDVAGVMEATLPALRPGSVWVDCTSGEPDASVTAAQRLADLGVTYLDAPVSGGVLGARSGSLTVMVGGQAESLDKVMPVLDTFSARVVHVGEHGTGFAVKAINNAMMAVNMWAAAEGLLALDAVGVDRERALEVINTSSGRSFASESLLPGPMASGEYPLRFKMGLLHKDAGIAGALTRMAGQPAPLLAQIVELLGMARTTLGGEPDYVEMARALKAWRVEIPGQRSET